MLLVSLHAQDFDNLEINKAVKSPFSLGAHFSLDACYRQKIDNPNDTIDLKYVLEFENKEQTFKQGYSVGINLDYTISERLALGMGLGFATRGWQWKNQDYMPPFEGIVSSTNRYRDEFIDIPISISHFFGKGKTKFILGAGAEINIFLQSIIVNRYEYEDGHCKTTHEQTVIYYAEPNDLGLSLLLKTGWLRECNMKRIKVEPVFRYSLTPLFSDTPALVHLWSVGINLSCYFH